MKIYNGDGLLECEWEDGGKKCDHVAKLYIDDKGYCGEHYTKYKETIIGPFVKTVGYYENGIKKELSNV